MTPLAAPSLRKVSSSSSYSPGNFLNDLQSVSRKNEGRPLSRGFPLSSASAATAVGEPGRPTSENRMLGFRRFRPTVRVAEGHFDEFPSCLSTPPFPPSLIPFSFLPFDEKRAAAAAAAAGVAEPFCLCSLDRPAGGRPGGEGGGGVR